MPKDKRLLRAAVPIYRHKEACQPIVTTREFGRWVTEAFGTSDPEIVIAATHITNNDGRPVHPGGYLNHYFAKKPILKEENKQRSFRVDSEFVMALIKRGLADIKDMNKLAGSSSNEKVWLKVYTLTQIEIAFNDLLRTMGRREVDFDLWVADPLVEIKCSKEPTWEFDQLNKKNVPKTKSLFQIDSMPAKEVPVPSLNKSIFSDEGKYKESDRGAARYAQHGARKADVINLRKINIVPLGWEYINVAFDREACRMLINKGTYASHSAKLRQDGSSFTLGQHFIKSRFQIEPGLYKLRYVEGDGGTIIIDFNERTGD